jgi:hypothetical protein
VTSRWLEQGRSVLPHVGAVAWRLLVAVAILEFIYLLVATVVLKTSLLKDFAARGGDLRVDYTSAYSVVPGRIEVEGLRVRFHDRNVEFQIGVEQGTLDVSLHELAVRRFHALRVDGKKVSYRMRHKVSRVGKEGPRLAAYPPIPGFRDPPLYAKGETTPSPPIPDEEYDLWEVLVEGVRAEVAEVWILEYRYQGPGLATGAFHVQPARTYEVKGAKLALSGGKLTLGDAVVASRANLDIDCVVTRSETQKLAGLEPLQHITAGVRGRLDGMDLTFLDAYLGPRLGGEAGGQARLDADLRIQNGVVAPGSRLELAAPRGRLTVGQARVAGPVTFSLSRPARPVETGAPFELGFRSERLDVEVVDVEAAPRVRVQDVDLRAAVTPDLVRPLGMVRAALAPVRVEVPDLGALMRALPFARKLPQMGGRVALVASAEKDGGGPLRGGFRLALTDATLAVEGRRTLPWNGTLVSQDVRANLSERPSVDGTLALHIDRASALLPLVTRSSLARDLGQRLLDLEALEAKAKLSVADRARLELLEARSGILKARGWVVERKDGAHGRLLLVTPAANVGVTITPLGTETELLVGDDWLRSEARLRGGPPRPPRGDLSRPPAEMPNNSSLADAARRLH